METQINRYQLTKTLRFGLTKTNQNLYSEKLKELIDISEERLKEQFTKSNDDDLQIDKLRTCLDNIMISKSKK